MSGFSWRVDVSIHAASHHLFYDREEDARGVMKKLAAAMDEFREFGMNRDAPQTVLINDAASEAAFVIRNIQAVRLIDERGWAELADSRLDQEAEEQARRELALERAKGRLKGEAGEKADG